jgi:broad specificity phosphatase PhoE
MEEAEATYAVQTTPTKFKTPTKKVRRRQDGSPMIPLNLNLPVKTIYIIRHGQSQGQAALKNGLDRRSHPSLRDCDLTPRGQFEALGLKKIFSEEVMTSIQLVLSSPLTRALHTSLLGFPTKNILVHFDLREIGAKAPENCPRDMEDVLKDLETPLSDRDGSLTLDVTSLQPPDWPRDYSPPVIKRERIRKVFQWLYKEREELTIAVVCHYNVIRTAVIDGEKLRPINATPIRCSLYPNGELIVSK